MKNILFLIAAMAIAQLAMAQPPCTPVVTLTGNITANRTLFRDSIYQVDNCVQITNNSTLTIQDGTIIEFVNNSILMIREDGQINAIGTPSTPIIMTSGVGSPGSRSVVSNAGFVVVGNAPINIGSTLGLPCSETLTVGTTPISNSGTIQYLQVHFLGGISTSLFGAAVTFAGVGSATTLENIQVANGGLSGINLIGGAPQLREVVTQDNAENGIFASYGTQVVLEGYLENRKNPNAHHANGSWGIKIENNISNASATPVTNFYVTNGTIFGPAYCNAEPLSNDFRDGIYVGNNAEAQIYNSVIAGSHANGLFIDGAACIAKTTGGQIKFSSNSFFSNGTVFNAAPTSGAPGWGAVGGCNNTMALWLDAGPAGCTQTDNQIAVITDLGYNASFCEDYCAVNFTPDFVLTENTELDPPDGSSIYADRGAVQFNDLFEWITPCPQNAVYCSSTLLKAEAPKVSFAPNPATQNTLVTFEARTTGRATIAVLDHVTGAVLRSLATEISASGEQQVSISLSGLKEGVYTVSIQMKSQILYGQLVIK